MASRTLSPTAQCQAESSEFPAPQNFAKLSSLTSELQLLVFRARCLGIQVDVLVDSGASYNYFSQEFLDSLRCQTKDTVFVQEVQIRSEQLQVTLANGDQVQSQLSISLAVNLDNVPQQHAQYFIVGWLPYNIVLGIPVLQAYNPKINWQSFVIEFQNGKTFQGVPTDARAKHPRIEMVTAKTIAKLLRKDATHGWLGIVRDAANV